MLCNKHIIIFDGKNTNLFYGDHLLNQRLNYPCHILTQNNESCNLWKISIAFHYGKYKGEAGGVDSNDVSVSS